MGHIQHTYTSSVILLAGDVMEEKGNSTKGLIKFYLGTVKVSGFVPGVEIHGQSSVTSYCQSS